MTATQNAPQDTPTSVNDPGERRYATVNPFTGTTEMEFDFTPADDIDGIIERAHAAYGQWQQRPVQERADVIRRAAELMDERRDTLAALITKEMGKRTQEATGELQLCAMILRYYADNGPGFLEPTSITPMMGKGEAVVETRPIGVLLAIEPWNYPFYQVARFAAPNLMLGNTVILKHAESVPRSARAIAQLMADAGVPEGAYVNLFATHDQVETIISDPRLQGVSLTGSERAGAAVAAIAGANLKKCVLELGGSDPYVVLDAADVDAAAATAWETRISNTGQACNSNKRMIVMHDIYDDFVAGLTNRAQGLRPGDPAQEAAGTFSPLSSRKAAETLHEQVQDAVSKGATLHAGGELSEGPAAYYSPAVLTGVTEEMRAFREELFGPVAVVYAVADDDEALALANDTAYGLGGAVFSADEARARALAERLEVGMANVNTPAGEGADLPFGGVKRSGFGRELGPLGMDEFVNKRMFYVGE